MTRSITIEEAALHLTEIVAGLHPGNEIMLTLEDRPVAKIIGIAAQPVRRRRAGAGKGMLIINREDDEHLEDFKDYM